MRRDSSPCGRVLREATHHQLPAVPNSKGQPTVYVSSTFIDLEGHRAALKTALEKARYDVDCMEKYTAFDQRPLVRCLADVAAAGLTLSRSALAPIRSSAALGILMATRSRIWSNPTHCSSPMFPSTRAT